MGCWRGTGHDFDLWATVGTYRICPHFELETAESRFVINKKKSLSTLGNRRMRSYGALYWGRRSTYACSSRFASPCIPLLGVYWLCVPRATSFIPCFSLSISSAWCINFYTGRTRRRRSQVCLIKMSSWPLHRSSHPNTASGRSQKQTTSFS